MTLIMALRVASLFPMLFAGVYMVLEIRTWHILKVTHMTYLAWAVIWFVLVRLYIIRLELLT